jgi:cell division protein FtsL
MSDHEKWQQIASQQAAARAPRAGEGERGNAKLLAVIMAAAMMLLALGQVYLQRQVTHLASLSQRIEAQSAARQEALNKDVQERIADLDRAYKKATRANEPEKGVDQEEVTATATLESTREELKQAKSLAEKLQAEQRQQASDVAHQLAGKADRSQVGALSQDVSATREDLDSTRKSLRQALENLGMTRTEFGTLIGRNHDEIAQLRQLGERDYFEFTLNRANRVERVAGIGLDLRRTDVKRLRYTLRLYVDDQAIEKKDRTINEPVFFYTLGRQRPLELVVNKVESGRVAGYVSVPKGTVSARIVTSRPPEDSPWEPFKEVKTASGSPPDDSERPSRADAGSSGTPKP